jgi:hypothetical protein
MKYLQLSSYVKSDFGYDSVSEGKKNVDEILSMLKSYSLPKQSEEYSTPPAYLISVSENNFITISKPREDSYSFYFFYQAGNVNLPEVGYEKLKELLVKYSKGKYLSLFKEIAKSGEAYIILGSTFKAKILSLLIK